ncbi:MULTISPECIES: pyridoxal phosphate-dependent aminotransferase [Heyndrickxia]|jgi:aspartate aminotransferase|uniref:pyridoxal phosphate-dependent aminotransferase n=1 Tax=Heyndrickxia TaxID=2837504 RepID=UPI00071731FC|nr:pyridoxal phosphate-dependent aminotransferase [Heyndrickxia oleronia]NYV68961.1 pyridoxal phosphate-dependent aminotransferase [Bacillus sp. Gen3]OJH18650.1 aspartate aminotransferase [Bacillus obstructivus]MBU5213620.1 pyridoxal phosphate-dependent aminotransferase [Heyndrickxia oleronia]MCI1592415.1 pyridoxal phosphate-dependent aminotransferase [Heyndrickxia oleronia]MCI1612316.1 pyridoxal phosphate-dependent aminotransferase [Heyndrickxia oleronia]
MTLQLANRVSALTPSSTLAITAKAKAMKAEGIDVIGLGAGEPDFNTPQHIIDAAIKAMNEGQTKYTATGGLPELKKAIIGKFKKDQNIDYKPSEIIVTNGAKHALYTLFQVILNEGDEVIIPIPYWVSYPEQVKLAGGEPVYINGEEANQFKITADQLKSAITSKTKAIIINSPSNPTGMLYTKEELTELGEICLEHNILIISDEIYEKLIYGEHTHVSIAELSTELKNQTIIINGVSKSHSMTGWRIGYAAGNALIIKAMTDLASHSTSNPTTPSQYGAIAAYNGTQEPVETMREAFEDRLNKIHQQLIQIPGVSCLKPQGAFYLFPNVIEAAKLTGFDSVDQFAEALLEEANVAVIPGSGFGAQDYIRLSYATSLELLEKAIERIQQFVKSKMK